VVNDDRFDWYFDDFSVEKAGKRGSPFCSSTLIAASAFGAEQLGTRSCSHNAKRKHVFPELRFRVENDHRILKREGAQKNGWDPTKRANNQLVGLRTGRYTLRGQKEGFQTEVRDGMPLAGAIAQSESIVTGCGQAVRQQPTVEAGVSKVDPTTTTVRRNDCGRS